MGNYDNDFKIISSQSGTLNEILSINSYGIVNVNSFVKSSAIAFYAVSSPTEYNPYIVPANSIIKGTYLKGFDIILINDTAWNPNTGVFTVQIKGIYIVSCTCIAQTQFQGFSIKLNATTNSDGIDYGCSLYGGPTIIDNNKGTTISRTAIINASVQDTISIWSNTVGIVTNLTNLQACSSLSIYLLMPT